MKQWKLDVSVPPGFTPDSVWPFRTLAQWRMGDSPPEFPQSGDSAIVDGMKFVFELVERTWDGRPKATVRSSSKGRVVWLDSGFQLRTYAMHRVRRRRDWLTVPMARFFQRLSYLAMLQRNVRVR